MASYNQSHFVCTCRAMVGEQEGPERENGEPQKREIEKGKKDVWGEAARRVRPDQPERRERRSPPRRR